jgi:hypothetical protein
MTLFRIRPKTLCEVARRVNNGEQNFDPAVLEFLDTFYAHPELRASAIHDRPALIDALRDAYLAAVAEHLARLYGLPVPEWTEIQGNDLHKPFFAGGLESLKGVLVAESPTAFRRRLLFVSKDALSRPRSPQINKDESIDLATTAGS